MHRMVAGIISLSQHLSAVHSTPDLYRPACCPSCGLGRVWHHGHYVRKSDRSAAPEQAKDEGPKVSHTGIRHNMNI